MAAVFTLTGCLQTFQLGYAMLDITPNHEFAPEDANKLLVSTIRKVLRKTEELPEMDNE